MRNCVKGATHIKVYWKHNIKVLISVGCPEILDEEVIENLISIKNQSSQTHNGKINDLFSQE